VPEAEPLAIDASAIVEALIGTAAGAAARRRMRDRELHAPAHLDAEVLSALGRLHRAGELSAALVERALGELASAPIRRHLLGGLLTGAWAARDKLRLVDALYVELAEKIGATLLTTDARLARECELAELVTE
jgi:predicted nucleic acid-binding protein